MMMFTSPRGGRFPLCSAVIAVTGGALPRQFSLGLARIATTEGGTQMSDSKDLPPGEATPPTPRRTSASHVRLAPGRKRLIGRLWQSAERQVAEVEQRLAQGQERAGGLEQDAKTLAIVTRTVRDLLAIDEAAKPEKPAGDQPREPAIRNRSEFRAELAQRLEGLLAERAGAPAADSAEPRQP
jgi:hypothetical protein